MDAFTSHHHTLPLKQHEQSGGRGVDGGVEGGLNGVLLQSQSSQSGRQAGGCVCGGGGVSRLLAVCL